MAPLPRGQAGGSVPGGVQSSPVVLSFSHNLRRSQHGRRGSNFPLPRWAPAQLKVEVCECEWGLVVIMRRDVTGAVTAAQCYHHLPPPTQCSLLNTQQIFTAAKCQFWTRTLQLCKQANTPRPSPHLTLSQRNELQYADTDFYWFQLRGNRDRSGIREWLLSKQYTVLVSHSASQSSYLTRGTQWALYKKFV